MNGFLKRVCSIVALSPLVACTATHDDEHVLTSSASGLRIFDTLAEAGGAGIADQVAPFAPLLDPVDGPLPLPPNPVETLIEATATLSARLGLPQDPRATIEAAQLPPVLAGRVANTVLALDACTQITQAALAGQDVGALVQQGAGFDPARFAGLPSCAAVLYQATRDLEAALVNDAQPTMRADPTVPQRVDVWPVFVIDRRQVTNVYQNDYLLIADVGGDDRYWNNGGSNMVDLHWSPAGYPITGTTNFRVEPGPAQGCQRAIAGLVATDCVPAAAVLLDLTGADFYGKREQPDSDRDCDPTLANPALVSPWTVVRRMVTNGVGFAGVGILLDVAGNDRYNGKTVSNGAGHLGGIGILQDLDGDDQYSAVRNSEGFGLLAGLGLLHDEGGNDTYYYYMPPYGVKDDDAPQECDKDPRYMQGTGNLTGVGVLVDDSGIDYYSGAAVTSFDWPVPMVPTGRGGSQGFGNNGGIGAHIDRGGDDDAYYVTNAPGARNDNQTRGPEPLCNTAQTTCSGGLHHDE